MRYVVGYTPSDRGADAVALASAMARAQGAHLDLVYVVDRHTPYVAMNPEGSRVSAAEQKMLTAEREGMALVPEGLEAQFHVRQADSHAAGLIDAALEYKAGLIVVGAASAGLFKRYTDRQRGQRPAARLARSGGAGAARLPPHRSRSRG